MLVIKHNCEPRYKSTMIALEIALDIQAGIILLQEPFIGNWKLVYSAFNFYWLQRDKTAIRVMMVVKKDLLNKIVIEYKTDLVNYSYFIFFEIQDLNQQLKWPERKT